MRIATSSPQSRRRRSSATDIQERYAHTDELSRARLLRIALLDTGSVNVVGSGGGAQPAGDPLAGNLVYQNTAADVRYMVDYCNRHHLAASISIFEPGFLRLALAHHEAGDLPRGTLIKLYFGGPGALFGLPPTAASLDAYLAMLAGSGLDWLVAVQGGDVTAELAQLAIERGGHVRVGLEDYAGPRTPRNEELVAEVVALAEAEGRSVASPQEAARALDVPD